MKKNYLSSRNLFLISVLFSVISFSQQNLIAQSAFLPTDLARVSVVSNHDQMDGTKMLNVLGTDANTSLSCLPVEI